jgi:WD40 repeat protein
MGSLCYSFPRWQVGSELRKRSGALGQASSARSDFAFSWPQSARLWDASTGETKLDLRGHDNVVEAVAFAPSSACAAIRELSGIVRGLPLLLMELQTNSPAQAPAKDKSNPSHAFLATGSRDKTIKLWDGQTGQCLRTLVGPPCVLSTKSEQGIDWPRQLDSSARISPFWQVSPQRIRRQDGPHLGPRNRSMQQDDRRSFPFRHLHGLGPSTFGQVDQWR